jgi:hypothetical protein
MAASTVPAAKAALLTMIRALPDLNEASITWAEPTETEDLADELVFFEGVVTAARVAGARGTPPPLDETYTLTLKVRTAPTTTTRRAPNSARGRSSR